MDDRPSEDDRPAKRRVRFSDEFDPPCTPQQRDPSFRPTSILRAPRSKVRTRAQRRAALRRMQENREEQMANPIANAFPPFVPPQTKGAGPSHSPRPTILSHHHPQMNFGAGSVHAPHANETNACHFSQMNHVSPFCLSTSNGAGPSHSPNPTRMSTGLPHSFNPMCFSGTSQAGSPHTPSASHPPLFNSAPQIRTPTANGLNLASAAQLQTPAANALPNFFSQLSNGAGPSHSPHSTGRSLHQPPINVGSGYANGNSSSWEANASPFSPMSYVSPLSLSTSNGAGPNHSPNPTRMSPGLPHSFNSNDFSRTSRADPPHTPTANHTPLINSTNLASTPQIPTPTANGFAYEKPNEPAIRPSQTPSLVDPASSTSHAAIERLTPPTKANDTENRSSISSPSSPSETRPSSKDGAAKAPIKKEKPRHPCFNIFREGIPAESMAVPTSGHMSVIRRHKPCKALPAYYPWTATEASPWRRPPPTSPIPREESCDAVHVRYPHYPFRGIDIASHSYRRAMLPPSIDFDYDASETMEHPTHSTRRLSYGWFVAFAMFLILTIMGFAGMESRPKVEERMCSVHDARQYKGGWSVLVKKPGSLPKTMWLENGSAHISNLKDRCSSYLDCGEIELPCVEIRSGSVSVVGTQEHSESKFLLSRLLFNVVRLFFKVTGLVLFSPLYFLRAIAQLMAFACRIFGQCLLLIVLNLVPMLMFKIFIVEGRDRRQWRAERRRRAIRT